MTRWTVALETEGDRVVGHDEVVELADAVATLGGIASGIGTNRYGAQVVVVAGSREEAIAVARREFAKAVATAGLPAFPIVRLDAQVEAADRQDAGA